MGVWLLKKSPQKPNTHPSSQSEGCLIEYIPQGAYTKVTAIDPKSGVEVSIVGDSKATQAELNRIVVQKLRFVLAKKANGEM